MARVVNYPQRLSLALLPTPLTLLPRLSAGLKGTRIWVKRDDLTGCAESGNKLRKLEFCLAQALAEGADTIITCGGVQSNHCRATALSCARLGLACHLVLRGEAAQPGDGNLLLDQLAGASIEYHPATSYQARLPELLQAAQQRLQAAGSRPFVIPTGASDDIGVWGYVAASEELAVDCEAAGIRPDLLVSATGSGGTQAGLVAGNALFDVADEVWGMAVCDDAAWFQRKVAADLAGWRARYDVALDVSSLPVRVNDRYIGPGYARATAEVFATIGEVARLEGLVLDPVYTGKAFHGLLQELRHGDFRNARDVVFVHTGGIFGLFPQRAGFSGAAG